MSESIIDFSGLDSAAAAVTPAAGSDTNVQAPPDTLANTGADNAEVKAGEGTEGTEGAESEQGRETNPDGSPKVAKDGLEAVKSTNLASIRTTLKNLRDSVQDPESPEGKQTLSAIKELHGSLERWNAAKEIFPKGFSEMKDAASFIKEVGGREGYASMQEQVAQINETDQLLYSGSAELITNIVADLKSENKLDALGKMAPAFLDAVKQNDPAGYYTVLSSVLPEALRDAEVDKALNAAFASIDKDPARAKSLLQGIGKWFSDLENKSEEAKRKQLDPERVKLNAEKQEFETSKATERTNAIAKEADTLNNKVLGSELKHFLRTPFFKQFSRANLIPLGNAIKADLYQTLKADKAYQAQNKALWGAKTPDRAKIVEYHRAKLESIAADVVRRNVENMYPGYAKGGAAAGRAAEDAAKTAAGQKRDAQAVATGKPVFVAVKPKWDELDHSRDKNDYLYISSRGYTKSGKFITWKK